MPATEIERPEPPVAGDEKSTLVGFLDYQRQTLLLKCAGLTPPQLLSRSCPPSSLCLLGLLRHLSEVEYGWLHERFAGEPEQELYGPGDADLDVQVAMSSRSPRRWPSTPSWWIDLARSSRRPSLVR